MKVSQKLEIGFGLATSISMLLYISWSIYYFGLTNKITNEIAPMLQTFGIVWLFSLVAAICAHYNSAKQSNIALLLLFISEFFVITILGYFGFFIFIWGGPLYGFYTITPAILAFMTIILAIFSRLKTEFEL
jgi:hypothetical protein